MGRLASLDESPRFRSLSRRRRFAQQTLALRVLGHFFRASHEILPPNKIIIISNHL